MKPLATLEQLAARIEDGIPSAQRNLAAAMLDDASALVRDEAQKSWADDDGELVDVPAIIVAIVCQVARRAIDNPQGTASETVQGQTTTYGNPSADVYGSALYLTRTEAARVRRAAGRKGLYTISTTRDDANVGLETSRDPFGGPATMVPTTDGEPIRWTDAI